MSTPDATPITSHPASVPDGRPSNDATGPMSGTTSATIAAPVTVRSIRPGAKAARGSRLDAPSGPSPPVLVVVNRIVIAIVVHVAGVARQRAVERSAAQQQHADEGDQ
jgi:hypothetical protein